MELDKFQSITAKYNVDEYGSPISVQRTEIQQIHPLKNVIATNIIDEATRVQITNKIEVFNIDDIKNINQFYVDYANGRIYFHPDLKGQTITYEYGDIGQMFLSARNIYTEVNDLGEVTEYLSQYIEKVDDKLVELDTDLNTYKDVLDRVQESEVLINQLNSDIKIATPLQENLHNDVLMASEKRNELENAMNEAQVDIDKVVASGNFMLNVLSGQWVKNGSSYEKVVSHPCNSENVHISCRNTTTNDAVTIGYRILNRSSILLKSDEAIDMSVIISASYYKSTVDLNTDITEDVIKARGRYGSLSERLDDTKPFRSRTVKTTPDIGTQSFLLAGLLSKTRVFDVTNGIELAENVNYFVETTTIFLPSLSYPITYRIDEYEVVL